MLLNRIGYNFELQTLFEDTGGKVFKSMKGIILTALSPSFSNPVLPSLKDIFSRTLIATTSN